MYRCGFDILRSNGESFVCDVNGWASVKDSRKFWEDAADLLRQYCLQAVAPSYYSQSISRKYRYASSALPHHYPSMKGRASHDELLDCDNERGGLKTSASKCSVALTADQVVLSD